MPLPRNILANFTRVQENIILRVLSLHQFYSKLLVTVLKSCYLPTSFRACLLTYYLHQKEKVGLAETARKQDVAKFSHTPRNSAN